MGFRKDIIAKALAEKEKSRKSSEKKAAFLKNKVYEGNARLEELDLAVSAVGSSIAIAAMSGGNLEDLQKQISDLTAQKKQLLKNAGFDQNDFQPKYSCPLCNDAGFVNGKLCSCVTSLCSKLICENMSAEMPLSNSRFDNFDLCFYPNTPNEKGVVPRKRMSSILEFCKNYAEQFHLYAKSLLFTGNTGLGKTHLSLSIANEVIAKGYEVIYGPATKLFRKVEKERFGGNSTDYYDALLQCDLLIIDDLGTEFITQFIVSVVNDIVNSRLLENRPTIINTNYSLMEIEEKYSPRVTSRIIEKYEIKQFIGMDIRQIRSRKK